MDTKNIFKAVAMAMLMPAVLLTTSCSKGDDAVTNPEKPANTETAVNKGYALPVTVNVTRQDNGTRATFDGSKLNFSGDDKLFVNGFHDKAGRYAGTLNYVSEGTFSGTIYTQEEPYAPIEDILMHGDAVATLLPAGYESYGYLTINDNNTLEKNDDRLTVSDSKAFVASETAKAKGVEQLSYEEATGYDNGFALVPQNAVLNFTITDLEAGKKDVTLNVTRTKYGTDYTVTGSVTPNGSGVATFAIGIPLNDDAIIKDMENNLTVGSTNFTLPSTALEAGKIYNITRVANTINGKFSVGAEKKVYFSKGNLRYVSGTWSFFEHQYDCYDTYSADAWDKFGWSTKSTTYGMSTSTDYLDYSGDFVDWGSVMGEGWYTLSKEEWAYLFNTRTDATSKYGYATVNDVYGIIILPDAFVDPNKNNGSNAFVGGPTKDWNANVYTAANWALMEAAGAVFLPAAGDRDGASVRYVGEQGNYWSSTAYDGVNANFMYFNSSSLSADLLSYHKFGRSVRLVQDAR